LYELTDINRSWTEKGGCKVGVEFDDRGGKTAGKVTAIYIKIDL
jgi:hypothetical protein